MTWPPHCSSWCGLTIVSPGCQLSVPWTSAATTAGRGGFLGSCCKSCGSTGPQCVEPGQDKVLRMPLLGPWKQESTMHQGARKLEHCRLALAHADAAQAELWDTSSRPVSSAWTPHCSPNEQLTLSSLLNPQFLGALPDWCHLTALVASPYLFTAPGVPAALFPWLRVCTFVLSSSLLSLLSFTHRRHLNSIFLFPGAAYPFGRDCPITSTPEGGV